MQAAIDASYLVLDELEAAGFPYKRITKVTLGNGPVPVWTGESESAGHVEMDPDRHDARAIAHEVGHGFEERWRQATSEVMGQSMAEAIRYFVEKKMGNSNWEPRRDWRVAIEMCSGDFTEFKELLGGQGLRQKYS